MKQYGNKNLAIKAIALAFLAALLVVVVVAYRGASFRKDELAVANTFGQFQAFLESTNYFGAYRLMSSKFRSTHSLELFQARDANRGSFLMFSDYDWNQGATVRITGDTSFGMSFYFIKENGKWYLTDETSGFEKL